MAKKNDSYAVYTRWLAVVLRKAGYKIIYKCGKCNQLHKNIMANDDDMDMIIEISKNNS